MDDMFHVPAEILADNVGNDATAKPLSNDDVSTILCTLIERINDIYLVLLAIEGFDITNKQALLSAKSLNANNIIYHIDLINKLSLAMQEKLKIIQGNYIKLNS